jgi:hypothetical protein
MTKEQAVEKAGLIWKCLGAARLDAEGQYRIGRHLPAPAKDSAQAMSSILNDDLYDWKSSSPVSFDDAFEKVGCALSVDEIRMIDQHSGLILYLTDGSPPLNVEGATRVGDVVTVAVGPAGVKRARELRLVKIARVGAARTER